jgi:glycosyltransferase involved in cell wall biosynthesis
MNKVLFVLPYYKGLATSYVRAKALSGYEPDGFSFYYLDRQIKTKFDYRLIRSIFRFLDISLYIIYFSIKEGKPKAIYLIKPNSIMLVLFIRYVMGISVILDINEPMHLRQHLGLVKFSAITYIANGVVFESKEYFDFCKEKFKIRRAVVIEDTPQIYNSKSVDYGERPKVALWFGNYETSMVLCDFIEHIKTVESFEYKLIFLGLDPAVSKCLKVNGILFTDIKKYNREELIGHCCKSEISLVFMPNEDNYIYRGNLKAKFSMAYGSIPITSNLLMHRRLIVNNKHGFIFKNENEVGKILRFIELNPKEVLMIRQAGGEHVIKKFSIKRHAESLCYFFQLIQTK